MSNKLGNKVFFDLPGFGRIESMPGAEFETGGLKRDDKIADTGVAGFTEGHVAPMMSCKIPARAGLSTTKLNDLVDINVTVTLDTGQVWIMQNAWSAEPVKLSSGEFSLSMKAIRAVEVQ